MSAFRPPQAAAWAKPGDAAVARPPTLSSSDASKASPPPPHSKPRDPPVSLAPPPVVAPVKKFMTPVARAPSSSSTPSSSSSVAKGNTTKGSSNNNTNNDEDESNKIYYTVMWCNATKKVKWGEEGGCEGMREGREKWEEKPHLENPLSHNPPCLHKSTRVGMTAFSATPPPRLEASYLSWACKGRSWEVRVCTASMHSHPPWAALSLSEARSARS